VSCFSQSLDGMANYLYQQATPELKSAQLEVSEA